MPYAADDDKMLVVIGQNLKKARLAKGWSQEELSFESGLHRTYVGGIERGERNVSLLNIEKLAKALNVEINALLDFNNPADKAIDTTGKG